MDVFVIEGGRPLKGSVRCAGSKNAVLPILAASLLTDEPLVVPNAPRVADVDSMLADLKEEPPPELVRSTLDAVASEPLPAVAPAPRRRRSAKPSRARAALC